MGWGSAPPPPDPKETASAQTSSNIGTAIAQQSLNQTDQVTPYGNLSYEQTGTSAWTDPLSGQAYDLPRYTATQTLTPEQQAVKEQQDVAQLNLAGTAADQSGFIRDYLKSPVDLSNAATEARMFEFGSKRLDPMFARQREQLEQNMINRGIRPGSEAYEAMTGMQSQRENDAYNNLLLTGRAQSVQEALTERNQPINEIIGLMSGSQVQQPSYVSTPQTRVANTDYAGLVQSNYNQQLADYQNKQNQKNQLLGGLFGFGANMIPLL